MNKLYDVIIVGGGIVGATLALILAKSLQSIALIEAAPRVNPLKNIDSQRTIVLAYSSRIILESVGLWDALSPYATPVFDIHISDRGQFGTTRIQSKDENLPALGYVLPAETIHTILHSLVTHSKNIDLVQPAKFSSCQYQNKKIIVAIEQNGYDEELIGELLVAADGRQSAIRQFQNIKVEVTEYQQTAIMCTVSLKRSHQGIAYERFTAQGPLAMLPLPGNDATLIWTVGRHQAGSLLSLGESEFRHTVQLHFGYRLGKFVECSQRQSLGLALMTAQKQISPGVVLLGDAVHRLHPVAGQGLNLALRDLAVLAEEINDAKKNGQSIGELETLSRYVARRERDQKQIIALTHSLIGIFSNSLLPVVLARNAGLLLLDRITWLKKLLTQRTLGLSGKVPRLACGLPLAEWVEIKTMRVSKGGDA